MSDEIGASVYLTKYVVLSCVMVLQENYLRPPRAVYFNSTCLPKFLVDFFRQLLLSTGYCVLLDKVYVPCPLNSHL